MSAEVACVVGVSACQSEHRPLSEQIGPRVLQTIPWDSSTSLDLSISLLVKCGIRAVSSGMGGRASCHHRRNSLPRSLEQRYLGPEHKPEGSPAAACSFIQLRAVDILIVCLCWSGPASLWDPTVRSVVGPLPQCKLPGCWGLVLRRNCVMLGTGRLLIHDYDLQCECTSEIRACIKLFQKGQWFAVLKEISMSWQITDQCGNKNVVKSLLGIAASQRILLPIHAVWKKHLLASLRLQLHTV